MPAPSEPIKIFAHRGFSSRHPEMTVAAYRAAVDYAAEHQIELGLECDVHFSADDQLICLHDLLVDRTSVETGPAFARSVEELRGVDFGMHRSGLSEDERSIVSLADLFEVVERARTAGTKITVNVETKHPNPRGFAVDDRVAEMIIDLGWQDSSSPIRVISFAPASLSRIGRLLPHIRRTYLVERDLGPVLDGRLPDGIDVVGPDLRLIKDDPDFVARARSHGNEVHVWTVNSDADIEFCLDLGVTGFTTDAPDRVHRRLAARGITTIGDLAAD